MCPPLAVFPPSRVGVRAPQTRMPEFACLLEGEFRSQEEVIEVLIEPDVGLHHRLCEWRGGGLAIFVVPKRRLRSRQERDHARLFIIVSRNLRRSFVAGFSPKKSKTAGDHEHREPDRENGEGRPPAKADPFPKRNSGQRHHPWQQQQDRHRGDEDDEVENEIAQVGGDHRPGIGAEPPQSRREIIAEAAQEPDFLRLFSTRLFHPVRVERGLDIRQSPTLDPRQQPAPDVAAPGNGRKIIELAQQLHLRQRLEHAEIESGAPNPAPGKGEPDQLLAVCPRYLIVGIVVRTWRHLVSNEIELRFQDLAEVEGPSFLRGLRWGLRHNTIPFLAGPFRPSRTFIFGNMRLLPGQKTFSKSPRKVNACVTLADADRHPRAPRLSGFRG